MIMYGWKFQPLQESSAGTSTHSPLHRDTMFVNQQIIDECVQTYQQGHKLKG